MPKPRRGPQLSPCPGVGNPRSPAARRRPGHRPLGWLPWAEVVWVTSPPPRPHGEQGRPGVRCGAGRRPALRNTEPSHGEGRGGEDAGTGCVSRCLCRQQVARQDLGQAEGRFVGEGHRKGAAPPHRRGGVLALAGWWLVAWSRWLRPACSSPQGPLVLLGLAPSPLPSRSHAPAPTAPWLWAGASPGLSLHGCVLSINCVPRAQDAWAEDARVGDQPRTGGKTKARGGWLAAGASSPDLTHRR